MMMERHGQLSLFLWGRDVGERGRGEGGGGFGLSEAGTLCPKTGSLNAMSYWYLICCNVLAIHVNDTLISCKPLNDILLPPLSRKQTKTNMFLITIRITFR